MRGVGGFGGVSTLSYSSRVLFCTGLRTRSGDLARIRRLEAIGRRSLCLVYSAPPTRIVSIQWQLSEPGEYDDELAALVARILAQSDRRLLALSPPEQVHIAREQADLEAFGLIDSEFALVSAPAETDPAAWTARRAAVLRGSPVSDFFTVLGDRWSLTATQQARFSPAVSAALRTGRTPDSLAAFTGANTDGVHNPYAVLAARLSPAELPAPPRHRHGRPRAASATRPPACWTSTATAPRPCPPLQEAS